VPYSGNPNNNFEDAVRYLLGDTDPSNELITDSEIAYLVTSFGSSAVRVAAQAARMLGHRYAHRASQSIGRVSVQWGEVAAQMAALAADLETRIGLDAVPFAGGISIDQVAEELDDDDRPASMFDLGMHDVDAIDEEEDLVAP
jgi:hypothetical protein